MNSKYDPKDVIADLKAHNVDMSKFSDLIVRMTGGLVTSQPMFEFIYDCVKTNNYNMDLFFSTKD